MDKTELDKKKVLDIETYDECQRLYLWFTKHAYTLICHSIEYEYSMSKSIN